MPRMHILTAAEYQAFDTPPMFSDAERATFFQVSESLDTLLAALRSPTNRVYLVLTVLWLAPAPPRGITAEINATATPNPRRERRKTRGFIPDLLAWASPVGRISIDTQLFLCPQCYVCSSSEQ